MSSGGLYSFQSCPDQKNGKLLRNNLTNIAIEKRENSNREYTKITHLIDLRLSEPYNNE